MKKQGIPGNLPQRSDLTFTINLIKIQATTIQPEENNIVATAIELTTTESEDELEQRLPVHLVTYTKITIEIVTKYSEPRITEISNVSDKEEPKEEKASLGKEHGPERAIITKPLHKEPVAEKPPQTNHKDNKDMVEGIEILEDKDQYQPSTSNIKRASQTEIHTTTTNRNSNIKQVFKTVLTALWPEFSDSHFLFHSKHHRRNP